MQRYKDGANRTAADPDRGITVNNLTVTRYLELKQAEKDLRSLAKRIAACAVIDTTEIDRKEEKYRKMHRALMNIRLNELKEPTEQERAELEKLEDEWINERESPTVTIDKNKITALILEYAACGMDEQKREHYGLCDGLPDGTKVKMK